MNFFLVGAYYLSIKEFFITYYEELLNSKIGHAIFHYFDGDKVAPFDVIFSYVYLSLLLIIVLISLSVPIDRAMSYFRVVAIFFSLLTIVSIIGIASFLADEGFDEKSRS